MHGFYQTWIGSRMRSIEWWHCPWPWVPLTTPLSAFCTAIHSFVTGERRDFKFGILVYHSKSHPADEKSSLKGVWSGSREQFLHCGLRKFRHSKSSVYRWYPQLDSRWFVYDTYRTMSHLKLGWTSCIFCSDFAGAAAAGRNTWCAAADSLRPAQTTVDWWWL